MTVIRLPSLSIPLVASTLLMLKPSPALASRWILRLLSELLASTSMSALLRSCASRSARAVTPQSPTVVEALPHTFRGREAMSAVGRAEASTPYCEGKRRDKKRKRAVSYESANTCRETKFLSFLADFLTSMSTSPDLVEASHESEGSRPPRSAKFPSRTLICGVFKISTDSAGVSCNPEFGVARCSYYKSNQTA